MMIKYSTKRIVLSILVSLAITISAATAIFIKTQRSFDPLPSVNYHFTKKDWANHIKVGIIGDSWVAGKQLDKFIQKSLSDVGINAEVVSSGQGGAKSRQIYRNLFTDENRPNSSKHILMDRDIKYLVVVAGVNDTATHIGKDFYAHHISAIVQAAKQNGIHPLIVEVPEYGIEYAYMSEGFAASAKHYLYKMLFDKMKDDVIIDYREALKFLLKNENPEDLTIISFDSIAKDYTEKQELYANPSHLNSKGYKRLGILIAENIVRTHKLRLKQTSRH